MTSSTQEAFNPFPAEVRSNPYPVYRRFRERAPVHYSEPLRAWVLFRHEDVEAALHHPALSADRSKAEKFGGRGGDGGLVGSDPPEHTRLRKLVNKAFTPAVVEGLRPQIQATCDDLLRPLEGREEFDLVAEFAYPFPLTVIGDLLGVPVQDRERLRAWSHNLAVGLEHRRSPRPDLLVPVDGSFHEYLRGIVEERREQAGDDLLSRLAHVTDGADRLSTGELIGLAVTLLFAGHETTVNLIGSGVLAMLRDGEAWARLRDERPALLRPAVEELLRFESPLHLTTRSATEDVVFGERVVPAGSSVVSVVASANRDEAVFDDAERLHLDRHPNPHVTFGHGIHFCVGAPLARVEAQIAFDSLLTRFPRLALSREDVVWRQTAALRGLAALPVRP